MTIRKLLKTQALQQNEKVTHKQNTWLHDRHVLTSVTLSSKRRTGTVWDRNSNTPANGGSPSPISFYWNMELRARFIGLYSHGDEIFISSCPKCISHGTVCWAPYRGVLGLWNNASNKIRLCQTFWGDSDLKWFVGLFLSQKCNYYIAKRIAAIGHLL